jgi:hypothetical protein
VNDSFFVAVFETNVQRSYSGTGSGGLQNCVMSIAPRDSLVLVNTMIGSCIWCVGVQASNDLDQCILKATFVPNIGARDSLILIGPRISSGTKLKSGSILPVLAKQTAPMKLYDLSGRCVDKLSVRKYGVYIATYGQGNLVKKLMIGD